MLKSLKKELLNGTALVTICHVSREIVHRQKIAQDRAQAVRRDREMFVKGYTVYDESVSYAGETVAQAFPSAEPFKKMT